MAIEEKRALSASDLVSLRPLFDSPHRDQLSLTTLEYISRESSSLRGGSFPLFLCGYEEGALVGVAVFFRSRDPEFKRIIRPERRVLRSVASLLQPLANLITGPMYFSVPDWFTGCASPWLTVSPDRLVAFKRAVIESLNSKGLVFVLDDPADEADLYKSAHYISAPGLSGCSIDIATWDEFARQKKNLKKKVSRFKKQGGTTEVVEQPLSAARIDDVLSCQLSSQEHSSLGNPSKSSDEVLDTWSRHACSVGHPYVTFIASLHGAVVGFQTFIVSGTRLLCFSGGFKRNSFHAYENLVLAAVDYAKEKGLQTVHMGVNNNPTKESMTNLKTPMRVYTRVRISVFRFLVRALIPALGISAEPAELQA
jgi:hypothetical protein